MGNAGDKGTRWGKGKSRISSGSCDRPSKYKPGKGKHLCVGRKSSGRGWREGKPGRGTEVPGNATDCWEIPCLWLVISPPVLHRPVHNTVGLQVLPDTEIPDPVTVTVSWLAEGTPRSSFLKGHSVSDSSGLPAMLCDLALHSLVAAFATDAANSRCWPPPPPHWTWWLFLWADTQFPELLKNK